MPSTAVSNNLTQSLWHRYAEQLCSAKNMSSHRAEAPSLITFPVPWAHGIPQSRATLAECRPPPFPALGARVGLRLPRLRWALTCRPAAFCAGLTDPSEPPAQACVPSGQEGGTQNSGWRSPSMASGAAASAV